MKQMGNIPMKRGILFMVNDHFVYMLKCKDNTLYTGYTTDVAHRLMVHESGKGAKYTRGRGPFELVYLETLASKGDALRREMQIKKLPREAKLSLVATYQRNDD